MSGALEIETSMRGAMRALWWVGLLSVSGSLAGCGETEPRFGGAVHQEGEHQEVAREMAEPGPAEHEPSSGPRPTRVMDDGARLFGAELGDAPTVTLSEITASPERFAGQVVRTEGTIERVCQRMGCWMELRAESAPAVRVPMAGHAFFLPRDVAGRSATIEGRVAVQALSPEHRAHLESEGALATASTLSIDATGVVIR